MDRLGENGQKSPKKAPKTPGMTLICVFTLKTIDFRPKIIGEEKLVPQIFKSAMLVVLKVSMKVRHLSFLFVFVFLHGMYSRVSISGEGGGVTLISFFWSTYSLIKYPTLIPSYNF